MKQKIIRTMLVALGLLATGIASAQVMTEADMIQRLSTPTPTAKAKGDNSFSVFINDGVVEKGSLRQAHMPDTTGACLPEHGANEKTLVVISLAPPDAPMLDLPLQFALASDVLSATDKTQLNVLANAMKREKLIDARFTVSGHTDASGDTRFNKKLSCDRSLAARTYLIEHGIAPDRLQAYGFGSSHPVVAGVTIEAKNRRVEFRRAQ